MICNYASQWLFSCQNKEPYHLFHRLHWDTNIKMNANLRVLWIAQYCFYLLLYMTDVFCVRLGAATWNKERRKQQTKRYSKVLWKKYFSTKSITFMLSWGKTHWLFSPFGKINACLQVPFPQEKYLFLKAQNNS